MADYVDPEGVGDTSGGQGAQEALGDAAGSVKDATGKVAGKAADVAKDQIKKTAEKGKDEAKKKVRQNALKAMGKAIKTGLKELGKLILKGLQAVGKAIGSLIAAIGPVAAIIILVVVLILVVVIVVAVVVSGMASGTYEGGVYTSRLGVKNDYFYGERYFYYDYAYSSNEIADIYEEFTFNLLKDVNDTNNGVTISIDFSSAYDESAPAIAISTSFARSVSIRNDEGRDILYYTMGISHYGISAEEGSEYINIMSDYLSTNNLTTTALETLKMQIGLTYSKPDYNYMRNVVDRIIVEDKFCDEDGIGGIEKKSYLGMAFMQKDDITIDRTGIIFILDDGTTADASINYVKNGTLTEIDSDTADSNWFEDGLAKSIWAVDLEESPVGAFTAFDEDEEYLVGGKSLFKILRDGKYSEFFTNIDGDYSADNIMANINTSSYIYVRSNVSPDGSYYIVSDSLTKVK